MSQSHFFRVKIIEAVTASLDDIYAIRAKKLREAEMALAVFDTKRADRTWWQTFLFGNDMRDAFARCRLEDTIITVDDWYKEQEKRLQAMYAFCKALSDDTVSITAQEFEDFSRFYKE